MSQVSAKNNTSSPIVGGVIYLKGISHDKYDSETSSQLGSGGLMWLTSECDITLNQSPKLSFEFDRTTNDSI